MPTNYQPKRAQKRPRRRNPIPLLAAAAAVCLALIIIPSLGSGPAQSAVQQDAIRTQENIFLFTYLNISCS